MGSLSMSTKREVTKKYAPEYGSASTKTRGRMLDELVATTGWSRANARRQVTAAGKRCGPQRAVKPTDRTGATLGEEAHDPNPDGMPEGLGHRRE
jgi:hypothetical protein